MLRKIHCLTSVRPYSRALTNVSAPLCLGFLELDHDMKNLHPLPTRGEKIDTAGVQKIDSAGVQIEIAPCVSAGMDRHLQT